VARKVQIARQRRHTPHRSGPRVYRRGRYWSGDLRPWSGPRCALRNPRDDGWPRQGQRTEDEETARRWSWSYVEYYRDGIRRNHLGLAPAPRKLADAVTEYLDGRGLYRAKNTVSADHAALSHLADWFGEKAMTDSMTAAELQKLVNTRLKAGYAPSSMKTLLTSWSPFFAWLGGSNPAKSVELPSHHKPERHSWTDEEIEKLLEGAEYVNRTKRERDWPDVELVVRFFLDSGCRQMEGYAAEWERISAKTDSIRIVYQLDRQTNERAMLKGKLARTALLLPGWRDWYRPDAKGLILGRPDGKPLGYRSQVNLLTRVFDAARLKIPQIGHHSLRHTYARRFLEADGTLEQLQKFLGHVSIKTTEEDYAHFSESAAIERARKRLYRRA
jgi:integrase/recombinase XerD